MPLVPYIREVAPAEKRTDGYYHLTGNWKDRPMGVFAGQHIGVVIGGQGEGAGLPLTLQAFNEDGTPLTTGTSAVLPPGKTLTYDFALQPKHLRESARIVIQATPVARPRDRAEITIETFPGAWGLFPGDLRNPLPPTGAVDQLAAQTGHPLCDDHRRFLETVNGLQWTWWRDPLWRPDGKPLSQAFFRDFSDAQFAQPDIGLLIDAQFLFGVGPVNPYLSYPDDLGDMGFYDTAFLRFGIPVGADAGGNLYVQILDGARRGEVVFLDHEYHYGMLDDADPKQLMPDVAAGGPDKPLQEWTADEFWAQMSMVGYALPAAPDLDQMIARLSAHHQQVMDTLAPKWRG